MELELLPVAKLIVLNWRDKVDSVIWLSYRPARLQRLTGRYNNPMPKLTLFLQSETVNLATVWPLLSKLSIGQAFALFSLN